MALDARTFSQAMNYSRPSPGTRTTSAGKIEEVPANQPRFDFNPITGAFRGILIEEARTNLIAASSDYSKWTRNGDSGWIENYGVAPDGTKTSLMAQAGGTRYIGCPTSAGATYTYSIHAKVSQSNDVYLYIDGFEGASVNASFDPVSGAVNSKSATAIDAKCTELDALGFRRYSITFMCPSTSCSCHIFPGGDIEFWGAQLEAGEFATSYIPNEPTFISRASDGRYFDSNGVLQTAAANVARIDHDPATKLSKGLLLEWAAINHILNSSLKVDPWCSYLAPSATDHGVDASVAAPDGTAGARRITAPAACDLRFGDTFNGDGRLYAGSVWIRTADGSSKTVMVDVNDSSPEAFTVNGTWQRVAVARSRGDQPYRFLDLYFQDAGSFHLWGAQLEAGDRATSYIPTAGSEAARAADVFSTAPVTRDADVASIPVSAIPGFNASEGTWVVEFHKPPKLNYLVLCVDDGASNGANSLEFFVGNDGDFRAYIASSGLSCDIHSGQSVVAGANRAAIAYKANDFAFAVNGAFIGSDNSGPVPINPAIVRLGRYHDGAGGAYFIDSAIKSVAYYPTRLSNAELQQVTTL